LDAVTLLDLGGEFVKKWSQIKNKFYFVFADVPWGILSRSLYRSYDTRFTKDQMAKIVDGIKQVLHPQGTGVLRLGPHDHDHWTELLQQKGFFVETLKVVAVTEPFYRKKAYCGHTVSSPSHHYWLVFHQSPPCGRTASWYEAPKLYGALAPWGSLRGATVWTGCPHVRSSHKLQHKDGNGILRVPENHINELCELVQRYCPPSGVVFDFTAGTGPTLLACIHLNRCCHINDRDEGCLKMAVSRAKRFLMFSGTHAQQATHTH
jgi:hypothetical protein